MKTITATEASRRFSELLDRVSHHHESVAIMRRGAAIAELKAIATIAEATTLQKVLRALEPHTTGDSTFADDLEAIQEGQPQPADDPRPS